MREAAKYVDYDLDPVLDSVDHVLMEAEFYQLILCHFWISESIFPKPEGDLFDEVKHKVGFLVTTKSV